MLRRRTWFLVCAFLPALILDLSSCDGEAPNADAAADAANERQRGDGESDDDAGVDVLDAARPPPVLPGCIGESRPLEASGERAYASVAMGNYAMDGGDSGTVRGHFLLDFGANGSTIDLKGFDTASPLPASCLGDAGGLGAFCSFNEFDFFGPWGTVGLVTADYGFLFNSVKQAGIIGTDFLSVYPFTIDYARRQIWRGSPAGFCTDAQLIGAGFAPIPAGGFYTNKVATLRPLSDVLSDPDAAATSGFTVPNVPTIPISIAGVSALAQLDTGYDDRLIRHSVNANQALLDRLLAQAPEKLTRRTTKDLFLTTCVPGLSQRGSAWFLAPGTEVNFLAEGGAVGRRDTGSYIFVKERLPEAERCGGIETWTVPAAQLGASFLVDAQAVVLDPITSRVWIPKD